MPSEPRLSILVPSYNYAAYLDETIAAVLAQSYDDLELLVCDDGSSDHSADLIRAWASRDRRVRAYFQSNQGVCATFRTLEQHARGEFVVTLGCDDVMEPNRLERGVEHLETHPECAAVFCDVTVIDSNSKQSDALNFPRVAGFDGRALASRLLSGNCFCASSGVLRRSAVLATGPIARNFLQTQDYDLWLRLARRGELAYQNFSGIRYRWHGTNLSSKNAWLCAWEERRLLDEHGVGIVRHHQLGQVGLSRLHERQLGLSVRLEDTHTTAKILFNRLKTHVPLTERQLVWLVRFALINRMAPQAKHVLSLANEQASEFLPETRAMLREVESAMALS